VKGLLCHGEGAELVQAEALPELDAPRIFCIPTEAGWISSLGGQLACGGGPSVGGPVSKEKRREEDF